MPDFTENYKAELTALKGLINACAEALEPDLKKIEDDFRALKNSQTSEDLRD